MSRQRSNSRNLLALAFTGLICWGFALCMPLSEVSKFGLNNIGTLTSLGSSFRENQQYILSLVADMTILVFPTLLFLFLPPVAFCQGKGTSLPGVTFARQICVAGKEWAMPEVLLLSVLVAFIKLGGMAEAEIKSGFYFLLASSIILIYLLKALELPSPKTKGNRNVAWALLSAAALLLVPANVLPVMQVQGINGTNLSTILGGVSDLFGHGLWGIAGIVFVASILVPFGKIGAIAWLLLTKEGPATGSRRASIRSTLHIIGRWSMLDVFLIGILAGLVKFGPLASIQAGPAAPAFAASVILTILAFHKLEPPPSTST